MNKAVERDGEKQEVNTHSSEREIGQVQEYSGRRRKCITTGQEFEKVLKSAWINYRRLSVGSLEGN